MTDFGEEVRELWAQAEEADKANRKEAIADLEFAAPDEIAGHWDPKVREYREAEGIRRYGFPLPCLTINTMPQFIGQVVGDRRANQTAIKVLPREGGDVKIAEIRSELIRSIEIQSKADRVRMIAFEQQVACGIGHTRIDLDYAYEDAFDRDLFIRSIPNPMSVLWDPLAADPTGRDATYCFVSEKMKNDEFERRFPKGQKPSLFDAEMRASDWCDTDTVRVAEYWKIEERKRTIAMLADGKVVDYTGKPLDASMPVATKADGTPMIRDALCKYAVRQLTNGQEELGDKFELKLHRVPIIRWMGRETWIGDRRVRFGLVRYARDPARLKDYNRSVRAELLMLMPRANFIAQASAVKGREDDWPNTLVHNDGTEAPKPISAQLAAALLEEAQMFSQDMKETTGIHEAELGMKSNETSGIAIQRRQQQGDIGTIIYHDNANSAMQEEGECLNALIDITHDTARTIRTVGADESAKMLRINDPSDPESIDLSVGRYDVTISTGPAYATRRQEQSAQLMELASRSPKFAETVPDYIVQSLDVENADKMAERFKRTIPPQILGDEQDDGKSPEEIQQAQMASQQAMQEQQQMKELQMRLQIAQVGEAEAKARKANAEAEAVEKGRELDIKAHAAETNRIKAITAKDFPLPPEAVAILAPVVTQAVMNALQSPDILPAEFKADIAISALEEADARQAQTFAPPEPDENLGEAA